MVIKEGTILYNTYYKGFFKVHSLEDLTENKKLSYSKWFYRVFPLTEEWKWEWATGAISGRYAKFFDPNSRYLRNKVIRIEGTGRIIDFSVIYPGEFEMLGWSVAGKAARILFDEQSEALGPSQSEGTPKPGEEA